MNRIVVCRRASCERPFPLIKIGGDHSGRTQLETVSCPYCGASWQERAGGVFCTARLSTVAEEVWREERGGFGRLPTVRLGDFRLEAPPFLYVYDLGDHWRHRIAVEALVAADPDATYPACIDGARSAPPEDVGGSGGYEDFLEAFADPDHPEHRQVRRWAGRAFDPERFDLARTDLAVRRALGKRRR